MKTTMLKVLDLRDLYPKISSQALPISTTYKLSKLFNAIKSEGEFYSTHLDEIISTYGKKDESGMTGYDCVYYAPDDSFYVAVSDCSECDGDKGFDIEIFYEL